MVFKAKCDKGALVIPITAPVLFAVVTSLLNHSTFKEFLLMLFIACFLGSCMIVTILSVTYILSEEELIISILGIKRKIAYKDIHKIVNCKGPWKVESPSMQQLQLYSKEQRLASISVNEMEKFETLIKSKCNQ